MIDSLLFKMKENVEIADVVSLMIDASDRRQRRADLVQVLKETKLAQHTHASGQKDQVGTGVDDNVRSALEHDKVNAGSSEGVCSDESDGATADDDNLEVARRVHVGVHIVKSSVVK